MTVRVARILAIALVLSFAAPAAAQPEIDEEYYEELLEEDTDLDGQRGDAGDLGAERAEVDAEIGSLRVSDGELQARIDQLEIEIREQQEAYDEAMGARLEALDREAAALAEAYELEEQIAQLEELLTLRAVDAYVRPGNSSPLRLLASEDVNDLAKRYIFLEMIAEHENEVLEELAETQAQIEKEREAADAAGAEAHRLLEAADVSLSELEAAKAEQQALKAELEDRIAHAQAEADALAAAQAEIQSLISAREAEYRAAAEDRARHKDLCARFVDPVDTDGSEIDCEAIGVAPPSLAWPVAGWVSSEFGPRWGRMHEGIDIAADSGANVVASAGGEAYFVGWIGGYGNTILIDHGGGLTTLYGHLASFAISEDAVVTQGQVIGYVGNTGNSQGPHLHFETIQDGAKINPRNYLP